MKKIFLFIKYRFSKFLEKSQKKRRSRFTKKKVNLLKNKDFSLLSNNCNGGVVLNELEMRFNSPFINLNINPTDYIKYLKNMDYYNSLTIDVKMGG